jgi:hypothetical protein
MIRLRGLHAMHAAVTVGLFGACVPATEELAPRGALGASLTPSAATRGEAFMTADGFTVTIERSVAYLEINPSWLDQGPSSTDYLNDGRGESTFADLRLPVVLIERGASPGLRYAACTLNDFGFLTRRGSESNQDTFEERFLRDLKRNGTEDIDIRARVAAAALNTSWSGFVRLHATRAGETWTMELPIAPSYSNQARIQIAGVVEANALREVPLVVRVENVLRTVNDIVIAEGDPHFEAFVHADFNHDRVITLEELALAIPPRDELPPFARTPDARSTGVLIPPKTMADLWQFRLGALFERP